MAVPTYNARILQVPTTFNNPALATLYSEPLLNAGSLVLVDPTHPWGAFPAAAYRAGGLNGAQIPNIAWAQAAQALGAGTATSLACVGQTAGSQTHTLIERTSSGAIHMAANPTTTFSATEANVLLPAPIKAYVNSKTFPPVGATSAAMVTGTAITSLPVTTTAAIPSGATLVIASGTNVQKWTTTAAVAVGATAIPVTSQTPTFAFPTGSPVVASAGAPALIHQFYAALSHRITSPAVVGNGLHENYFSAMHHTDDAKSLWVFSSWKVGGTGQSGTDLPPTTAASYTFSNRVADNADDTVAGLIYRSRAAQGYSTSYGNTQSLDGEANAFHFGRNETFTSGAAVIPSSIFYSFYLEDLTVSGNTPAQVDAIALARHQALFASGGRYTGDTWTAPSSIA